MVRHALSVVLALLMLMPAGVCTCEGGPRECRNHPAAAEAEPAVTCSSGCAHARHACPAATDSAAATEHQCPPSVPHEPSCPAVTASAPSDRTTAAAAPALAAAAPDRVLAWRVFEPLPSRRPLTLSHVRAAPIFITHCTLLI